MSNNLEYLNDSHRLSILHSLALLDSPAEEVFDRLTRLVSRIIKTPVSLVSLVDKDRQFFKSIFGELPEPFMSSRQSLLSHSFCQHVVATGEPLIISDSRLNSLVQDNLAIRDMDVISYLGMPLNLSTGVNLGSFCVIDNKPRDWTVDEIEIVRELARSVVTQIELHAEINARKDAEKALMMTVESIEEQITQRTFELSQAVDLLYEEVKAHQTTQVALEKQIAIKSDFIALIAHEFRNPLAVIQLASEMMQRYPEKVNAPKQLIRIQESVRKMLALITQGLQQVERAQDNQPLVLESVEIPKLVQKIVDDISASNNTSITIQIEGDVEPIQTVSLLIEHILREVLQNAIKYTKVFSQIALTISFEPEQLQILVVDNGIGIEQKDLPYIYEPFFRGLSIPNVSGIGLGLYLVKQNITRLKGEISIQSTLGEGTQTEIILPRLQQPLLTF